MQKIYLKFLRKAIAFRFIQTRKFRESDESNRQAQNACDGWTPSVAHSTISTEPEDLEDSTEDRVKIDVRGKRNADSPFYQCSNVIHRYSSRCHGRLVITLDWSNDHDSILYAESTL